MSKFEWVELETLSAELSHLQSRIDAARVTKNYGLVQLLEREIAAATERRTRVLADITKGLSKDLPIGRQPKEMPVPAGHPEQPDGTQEIEIKNETNLANNPRSTNPWVTTDTTGDLTMWDKVTADDLERVKRGVATRRAEMLARHAGELKALENEQAEIDAVEKAIAVFTQRFKVAGAEIVPLGGERVPVQAG
jgi:hypothetical protein